MLTENDIKEELSYSMIHAIAARAGFSCERPKKDRDSVDVELWARGNLDPGAVLHSPRLDVQLKATARDGVNEDRFPLEIPIKNYRELRLNTMVPRLLVVVLLPIDPAEWLFVDEQQLVMRRCAYWCNLKGAPESPNTASRTVQVLRSNRLTPESLRMLMIRAAREEEFGHAL